MRSRRHLITSFERGWCARSNTPKRGLDLAYHRWRFDLVIRVRTRQFSVYRIENKQSPKNVGRRRLCRKYDAQDTNKTWQGASRTQVELGCTSLRRAFFHKTNSHLLLAHLNRCKPVIGKALCPRVTIQVTCKCIAGLPPTRWSFKNDSNSSFEYGHTTVKCVKCDKVTPVWSLKVVVRNTKWSQRQPS
jgi:hypothetical protein